MNHEKDMQADVVIIGSGASGLCAALTLSYGGASVLVFEQESEPGGMTNYAEGMFAVGSRYQKKHKVGLTVEEAFNVHMEETHWLANPRLVRTFMEKTAGTIDWLEEQGAEFSGLFTISPFTERVWHQMEGFGKEGLIKPLYKKAKKQDNVDILFETEVKSLMMEKAAGWRALSPRMRTAIPSGRKPERSSSLPAATRTIGNGWTSTASPGSRGRWCRRGRWERASRWRGTRAPSPTTWA